MGRWYRTLVDFRLVIIQSLSLVAKFRELKIQILKSTIKEVK